MSWRNRIVQRSFGWGKAVGPCRGVDGVGLLVLAAGFRSVLGAFGDLDVRRGAVRHLERFFVVALLLGVADVLMQIGNQTGHLLGRGLTAPPG